MLRSVPPEYDTFMTLENLTEQRIFSLHDTLNLPLV